MTNKDSDLYIAEGESASIWDHELYSTIKDKYDPHARIEVHTTILVSLMNFPKDSDVFVWMMASFRANAPFSVHLFPASEIAKAKDWDVNTRPNRMRKYMRKFVDKFNESIPLNVGAETHNVKLFNLELIDKKGELAIQAVLTPYAFQFILDNAFGPLI